MVIYDILSHNILKKVPINPNLRSRKYMFIDDQGFFSFKVCRSSDIKEKKIYSKEHVDKS